MNALDPVEITTKDYDKLLTATLAMSPYQRRSKWAISYREAAASAGWLISHAALVAVVGLVAWCGEQYGHYSGVQDGFQRGCQAALGPAGEACVIAQHAGTKIDRLWGPPEPGKGPIPIMERDTQTAAICAELRTSVPDTLAAHYGCPIEKLR